MFIEQGVVVIKPTTDGLLKIVETAIRGGQILLLEDVGESLEPLLEPLLLK